MHQSFSLNEKEKIFCLGLARKVLESELFGKDFKIEENKIPKKLFEKKACFVTLTKNNNLRGCVGHLDAFQELYKDIIDNSINAAFCDSRFSSLKKEELKKIRIEISVLTDPKKVNYSSPEELLEKIVPKKDGLIISNGFCSSTFLPTVWEQLKTKKEFLEHLCMKAGFEKEEWKKNYLEVKKYETIVFQE